MNEKPDNITKPDDLVSEESVSNPSKAIDSLDDTTFIKKPVRRMIILGSIMVIVIIVVIVGAIYYISRRDSQTSTTSKTSTSNSTSTTSSSGQEGLKSAKWSSDITITYSDTQLEYKSNGIPNHTRQVEYALPDNGVRVPSAATAYAGTDPTKKQSYDYKIPIKPTKAVSKTKTSLGLIGVMISGAGLFNPYEGDNSTVATASNFTVKNASGQDIAFLDSCSGHPTPMGQYHYHALPSCVTAQVDVANGPSHIIGVAFDGYPIYGDKDINGKQVAVEQLDECNGITSVTPEYPNSIYHYVLLNTNTNRSSINCLSGVVDASLTQMNPAMRM